MSTALRGKVVVNTRAVHQAAWLDDLLRARGAVPLAYPCIAIAPPADSAPLDQALIDLTAGRFAWLVLTSVNTVLAIAQRLNALGLTLAEGAFRTAAIGPATAEAAQQRLGLRQIEIPSEHFAEALAAQIPIEHGMRVLLPESTIARTTLADLLTARAAAVSVVDAYQTVCGQGGVELSRLLAQHRIDAITFTSSSTVTCLLERLSEAGGWREDALTVCAACIGSKTAETARACGFKVVTTALEQTQEGLLNALDVYFSQRLITGEQI